MAALLDEHKQYIDEVTNAPLVAGKLYVGTKGNAPKTNPKPIFSDRELTIALSQPQILDAFGKTTNKVWTDGEYSLQVDNSNDVQKFQDLDAGETASSGITTLSNIQGTNAITAEASTTITEYTDKEIYTWAVLITNTGAATLSIDSLDADPLVFANSAPVVSGDLLVGRIISAQRNNTNSNFEILNHKVDITTGDEKLTIKTVADAGWVMEDDGSIGNASSSASNRANADTEALFTLLYNNMSDAECPVSSGRGANAAADFAANKNLTIPLALGRTLAISGSGSGLTARTLGDTLGEETHVQSAAELGVHNHASSAFSSTNVFLASSGASGVANDGSNTGNTGSSNAFNVMQPTAFRNLMIKL